MIAAKILNTMNYRASQVSVSTPRLMALLGYAGLLPFLLCSLLVWFPTAPFYSKAVSAFVIYGVVILAFLGGTLWGYAVVQPIPAKHLNLVISNLVALFAALAGILGNAVIAALLLGLGQLVLLLYERGRRNTTGWYLQLRTRLTVLVLPMHLLFIAGLMRAGA